MKYLKNLLPFLTLTIIVIIVASINYKPNTLLTGWDNLHPEFNLALNIKRSFFAVWQEYQSLGLLGGMGHASDIVRQIILLVFSTFLPTSFIRFFWTILTLIIGGCGAIALSKSLFTHSFLGKNSINKTFLPTIAGLIYIFNLATIQSYYVPFETFTAHFAFLPWMILSSLHFFNRQSARNAIVLALTLFMTTPQSYVPTLFVVFLIAVTILLASAGVRLVMEGRIKKLLTMSIKYYGIVAITNAFWLLPFAYFTITNASTNIDAKINQMATSQIALQNKEFANILDVMLLRGFWFNAVEPNLSRVSEFMLSPWRDHMSSNYVVALGVFIFAIILVGLINVIRKKEILLVAFSVLFIFVFALLSSNTPPFSYLTNAFSNIPLFSQAFRFPFTKFSILASLLYSLFFVFGIATLISLIKASFINLKPSLIRPLSTLVMILALASVFIFIFPVFKGNLFYEKEQIALPKEYSQTFAFFDKKDASSRIATLPMSNFWSWNHYNWGYGGSGFLWYGIKQPIIDRAFDVWSKTSENSYNEISYALYSKDSKKMQKALNKYQVSYLILDKNIYSNASPKSLFVKETQLVLASLPQVKKEATFGNIEIYYFKLEQKPNNFISSTPILPSSNESIFNNQDNAYSTMSNYKVEKNPTNYFPFISLYSNKLNLSSVFISENDKEITFSGKIPPITSKTLTLPSLIDEKVIPVRIFAKQDALTETVLISAQIITPKVTIGNKTVTNSASTSYPLFSVPANATYSLAINNILKTNLDLKNTSEIYTYLQLDNDNYFTLTDQTTGVIRVQSITKDILLLDDSLKKKTVTVKDFPKGAIFSVQIPKIVDSFYSYEFSGKDFKNITDCNEFRSGHINHSLKDNNLTFNSTNDSLCASVNASTLTHEAGYLVKVTSSNKEGQPLHFWTLNENTGIAPLDIYFDKKKTTHHHVLPPMESAGVGYSFHLDNISVGKNRTINTLSNVEVTRIPYQYLTNITLSSPYTTFKTATTFDATHPNESLYVLTPRYISNSPSTIVLSQSYDVGWKAYVLQSKNEKSKIKNLFNNTLPFLFGKELKTHIKVNNWQNGWEIDPTNPQFKSHKFQIVIVYLPQYLQYVGFIAFLLLMIIIPLIAYYKRFDMFFYNKSQNLKKRIDIKRSGRRN